jgi:hypothetical protein
MDHFCWYGKQEKSEAISNIFSISSRVWYHFNSPNFGLITGANPARFLQLVARFDF